MTQQEFQGRTQVRVNATEFDAINMVYMNADVDKDVFCKMWCKMNVSRVKTAKEQEKKQENIDKVLSMVMTNAEWSDVEHYNTIAVSVLSDKEQSLLEAIGISLESEPNDEGLCHFKRFGELRTEIHNFLKSA